MKQADGTNYLIIFICFFAIVATLLYTIYDQVIHERMRENLMKIAEFYYSLKSVTQYLDDKYVAKPVLPQDEKTVTWLIHMYPPSHNAGAEWMAHAINRFLVHQEGWKANVVLNATPAHDFERITVIDKNHKQRVSTAVQHSAVLLSHLDNEPQALKTAMVAKRPFVCVLHNNYRKKFLEYYVKVNPRNIYFIHNSHWIKEYYSSFNIPSIVVYPPVYWKEYETKTTREYVTLINLNSNKGGEVLIQIAKQMPGISFMGVKGGYNNQITDNTVENIKYVENTPYIKSIYAKTDILLVPSMEESWGRVAVEAMSSGIPVISHPTPGLLESCGSAGIFCNRDDIHAWVREIKLLKTDAAYYKTKSNLCKARARELDPEPQLKAFATWIKSLKWQE